MNEAETNFFKSITSWRALCLSSWIWANYDWYMPKKYEQCYLCNKKEDWLLNRFKIYHIFDGEQPQPICRYHKNFFDCFTGMDIKKIDDRFVNVKYLIYRVILNVYILIRFSYRFALSIFGWKIYFPIAWWWKNGR